MLTQWEAHDRYTDLLKERMSFKFGPYSCRSSQLFYESSLSYGLVNTKPVVNGHVLFIPKRVVDRFSSLTPMEVSDLFSCVHAASASIQKRYNAEALTITIQDGESAGQSVKHCHVHLLPRVKGDFLDNAIYDEVNLKEIDLRKELEKRNAVDSLREARSEEEMEKEALELRGLFVNNQPKI